MRIRKFAVLALAGIFLVSFAPSASAERGGGGGGKGGGERSGAGGDFKPRGWDKGEKKGWDGADKPPGLKNKKHGKDKDKN